MIAIAYLTAVILANLIVTAFGPEASIVTAFVLIGATLTLRDRLHDKWQGRGLVYRMGALIALGSLLSYLVNQNAGPIALASFAAFAASETLDALVYQRLRRQAWFTRVNASNTLSAAVDSLVFPTIAFGGLLWPIVLGQFVVKTLGGAIWSVLLRTKATKYAAVGGALALLAVSDMEAQEAKLSGPPRVVLQAQLGTIHYPWLNYRPTGNVGLNSIVFLPWRFSVLLVGSRDMTPGAEWVGVAALQWRIIAR